MKKSILYISLAALFAACTSKPAEQTEAIADPNEQFELADTITFTPQQIEYAEIKAAPFIDTILNANTNCVGVVSLPPQSLASVSVPLGGFVKEIYVMPNQKVRKGEVLALMANPEYIAVQQTFLEYTALTEQLRAEYERQKTLASNEAASTKKMQQAKADYEVALAKLQSSEATLAMLGVSKEELQQHGIRAALPLRAPINGYITELRANLGRYLDPNEVAFEVVEKTHLHLSLSVYEKDVARIAVGDRIVFRLVSFPKENYRACIESIGEKVISEERAVMVMGHIESEASRLKEGMYVTAELHSGGKLVKALPENAIINYNNHWYIFILENGQFRRVEVNRGLEQGTMIEIINADTLPADAQIVQYGAYYIQAELQKRIG